MHHFFCKNQSISSPSQEEIALGVALPMHKFARHTDDI